MNPILLLHGALGSASQLKGLQTLLSGQGRPVLTMNFSGHSGERFSPHGFGIEIFVEDTLRFMDEHQVVKADLFGYSMGGYVALQLAKEQGHRVGKVVTLGTKFDWSPESAAKEVRKMNPDKIEEKVPAFARLLQQRHAPEDWKELMVRTAQMMTHLGENPLLKEPDFRGLTHEVQVLLGDADDMADRAFSEQVANWLPQGTFTLLKDTPHPIEKVDLKMIEVFFGGTR